MNPDLLRDITQAVQLALGVIALAGVGTCVAVSVRVILFFKNLELLLEKVFSDQQTVLKKFDRLQCLNYKEPVHE